MKTKKMKKMKKNKKTKKMKKMKKTERNKLAKAWKMRKPAGTLGISLFGPGKLWFKKVCAQNMCIDFLAELDHSEEKVFGSKSFLGQKSFWVKKVFGSKSF